MMREQNVNKLNSFSSCQIHHSGIILGSAIIHQTAPMASCGHTTIVGNILHFATKYHNELFVFYFFLATTHVAFTEATVFLVPQHRGVFFLLQQDSTLSHKRVSGEYPVRVFIPEREGPSKVVISQAAFLFLHAGDTTFAIFDEGDTNKGFILYWA
jgi:hypothetical protein